MKHSITQPDVSRAPQRELLSAPSAEVAYLWSRTSLLKEVWDVLEAVKVWPGVAIASNRSGLCLALRGVTLGHVRWNGRIDLPFGPELRDRLVAEEMASLDPDIDRAVFDVRSAADVDRAVWLLRLAYLSPMDQLTASLDTARREQIEAQQIETNPPHMK
jgi:hypothetical protein